MCTTLVSTMTFDTYTNDTRFRWAIRKEGVEGEQGANDVEYIKSTNLLLCGSVASALFLITETTGIPPAGKVLLVLLYYALVSVMQQQGFIDATPSPSSAAGKGFLVFLSILLPCAGVVFRSQGAREAHLSSKTKTALFALFAMCFVLPLAVAVFDATSNTTSATIALVGCILAFVAAPKLMLHMHTRLRTKPKGRGRRMQGTGILGTRAQIKSSSSRDEEATTLSSA